MRSAVATRTFGIGLAAVHLDMARAHRNASLHLAYTLPNTAKKCRHLMRYHALKARGKIN